MILEVLHEIPYEFARAIEAEQRFPNAADLRQSVTHLYNTLVEKLGILIPILLRTHPEKNKLAKLWKQHPGKEQVVVQACLVEISRASKRVERCSAAALERTVGEIHRHIVDISGKTIHIIGKMDAWDGKMSSAIQNSKSELITWAKDQWQQYLGYNGSNQQFISPWAMLPAVNVSEPSMAAASIEPVRMPYGPMLPLAPSSPKISLEELLDALDVPEHTAEHALARVTRLGQEPRLNAGTRGEHLLAMRRFQAWLTAPSSVSDLILVDGNCGRVDTDRVSPMSASCASLVQVVEERSVATVLHHFCGQHLGSTPLRGLQGLIRNLTQQLLLQGYQGYNEGCTTLPAPDFIDDELLDSLGRRDDILSLCHLFRDLLIRLDTSRPVFCIIDGVSALETALRGWQADHCLVIKTLQDLVDDPNRDGPALRVLLASPERSPGLADTVVTADRCVSLPAFRALGRHSSLLPFQKDIDHLLMLEDIEDIEDMSFETGDDTE